MKRNVFVIFELLLMVGIVIGMIMIIYNGYHIFSGLGKSIVNVNDNNKELLVLQNKAAYYGCQDRRKLEKGAATGV